MFVRLHHSKHAMKDFEIIALSRLEWMLQKEWDDRPEQIAPSPHAKGATVIVISSHDSAAKEILQRMQELDVAFVLHDGEFREYLKTGCHFSVGIDPHVKATFTVHEACNPLRVQLHWTLPNIWSLRVPAAIQVFPADCPRARWIFTARKNPDEYQAFFEEFPAYGSV